MLAVMAAIAAPAQAETNQLTISATQTALLVWIAYDKGFFRDQGLDVKIQPYQSGVRAADALIDGSADLSTTADAGFVSRSFDEPNLRILATISATDTVRIVGRRDRGIASAQDLTGKRVGVTMGSAGEYFLSRYLTLNGVSPAAPILVDLKPGEIAESLVKGGIDAAANWDPFIYQAERELGDNAVTLPRQVAQIYYFLLLTTAAWHHQNPQTENKAIRALIEAEQFAAENPEAAKILVQKKFGYQNDYIDHIWPLNNLHVSLPQGLMFVLEQQAAWQIGKGLTSSRSVPDYLNAVIVDPLETLRPHSVGIVK